MKIVRFAADTKVKYGILDDESIQVIEGKPFRSIKPATHHYRLSEVKLLSPCTPSKIVAVGHNYRSHVAEVNASIPTEPLLFLKPSTTVIGPEANIIYHEALTRVDYEGELGIVIKRPAWHVSAEDVPGYVLGYTYFNDITARDLQRQDGQWTRGKSFDTFAAVGPCIETELDPGNLGLETHLNGELKQRGNISDFIFGIREMVSFISGIMTLLPGDIIATGTPSGIGPMSPGDTVEIKIESIGTLRNYIVKNGG